MTLLPAAAYTIVGAVVVAATFDDRAAVGAAAAMPDLSQEFPGRGPGLCGPTAAADVLHGIASRRPAVLAGLGDGRGQAEVAASLVLGENGLVELMAISPGDAGATNDGIRSGLQAWLDAADPAAWSVSLDWLEDEPRSRESQRRFLERLAAAVARGGGVVLCLWPGHDAATPPAATADQPSRTARSAARPAPEASPVRSYEPSPEQPVDAARAVAEAEKSIEAARRSLAGGRHGEAVEAVGRAVAAVRRSALADAACRRCLDEALEVAAEIDRQTATPPGGPSGRLTRFE